MPGYPFLSVLPSIIARTRAQEDLMKTTMRKQQILRAILVIIFLVIRMEKCLNRKRSVEEAAKFIPASELRYFCPDVDVCGSKRVPNKVSSENMMGDYGHCCEECSCKPNCIEERNCCYPRWKNYSLIDRSDQECFFPGTTPIPNSVQYFMTYLTKHENENSNSTFCLSKDAEGNFNLKELYPVYSPTLKKHFVNERCAISNNVTDGIPWDAYSICSSFSALQSSDKHLTALVENDEEYLFTSRCGLFFLEPPEPDKIGNEQCYSEPINSCSGNDFRIPAESNLSREDIIEYCQSGFFSPYNTLKSYANVFCFICNNNIFKQEIRCAERKSFREQKSTSEFFVMLDSNYMKHRKNVENMNILNVCNNSGNVCRKLYCPPGYIRQADGKCKCIILTWFVHRLDIKLKLIPEGKIHLSDIVDFDISWFRSPWPKTWELALLWYTKSDKDNGTINYLVVHLVNVSPITNYEANIAQIKFYLSRIWFLIIKGVKMVLIQKIYKYKVFHILGGYYDQFVPYWTVLEKLNHSFPVLHRLYVQSTYQINKGPLVYLIKTLFCEQIELEENDYTMYAWNTVLFYRSESRYLYDGEFTLVTNQHGLTRPRICVDETAFGKINTRTLNVANKLSGRHGAFDLIFVLFVVEML